MSSSQIESLLAVAKNKLFIRVRGGKSMPLVTVDAQLKVLSQAIRKHGFEGAVGDGVQVSKLVRYLKSTPHTEVSGLEATRATGIAVSALPHTTQKLIEFLASFGISAVAPTSDLHEAMRRTAIYVRALPEAHKYAFLGVYEKHKRFILYFSDATPDRVSVDRLVYLMGYEGDRDGFTACIADFFSDLEDFTSSSRHFQVKYLNTYKSKGKAANRGLLHAMLSEAGAVDRLVKTLPNYLVDELVTRLQKSESK